MADIYNSKIAKLLKFIFRIPKERTFGITISKDTTLYSNSEVSDRLRKHEEQHKRQWRRLGRFKFLLLYGIYVIVYGYRANPLEEEARGVE